ncbi:MAG TPA: 2Fe-2S iron-sulfur cluster binding domain-containing protein [Phycisphaerales bacterium]|nr:2Fe-2S iron-sulfur cluster binding domain-containing protein [Phycisphaerales bacterium]
MSETFTFTIDGVEVEGEPGQTILEAAQAAGVYIPRLCHKDGLEPWGGCRVCTVTVNGRSASACTQPAAAGITVENETDELVNMRRGIIEMLFVEGNHFCMFCEKSGNCELQALAYRLGIAAPRYEYLWPTRDVDASHPDVLLDRNRCILCARCVRTSRDLDGKQVFGFVGRGPGKTIAVNASARLSETGLDVTDEAVDACPVGAILRKREGYRIPVGLRRYDSTPIGSDIEKGASS